MYINRLLMCLTPIVDIVNDGMQPIAGGRVWDCAIGSTDDVCRSFRENLIHLGIDLIKTSVNKDAVMV